MKNPELVYSAAIFENFEKPIHGQSIFWSHVSISSQSSSSIVSK